MATSGQMRLRPAGEAPLVTSCGRRIEVRFLLLALTDRPISRVTLEVGPVRSGEPGAWASLTANEARALAHRLMVQACLAETAETAESARADAPASAPPCAPSA
jgi:hypothetical protein